MKKLLGIIVLGLLLITPSQADDIRDFEIEGMSLGDSALNYFDKSDLNEFYKIIYPKSDDYIGYEVPKSLSKINFSTYDSITFHYKKNDRKMKISALTGIVLYPNDLKKCLKKRDEISNEIKNILINPVEEEYIMTYGEGNDNKSYTKEFIIKNGSIKAWCSDWDENTEKEDNWQDDLTISVASEEFLFWVDNKAY